MCSHFLTSALNSISESEVKDLSRKGLKKIPKIEDSQSIKELDLSDNELQKIDNIDSFLKIEKVGKVRSSNFSLIKTFPSSFSSR